MSYPPAWRAQDSLSGLTGDLVREHPFALMFTSHNGLQSTRIPFVPDFVDGKLARLRAHLNAQNPQCVGLDGAQVLVVYVGRSTYVSPHWRREPTRGGTYDYEEVKVRGTARFASGIEFFRTLIDDLSALIEPQYAGIGDYPVWQTAMAPEGYVERLFPAVTPFTVEIESVETISKLHQQFPEDDRRSIAHHLARSHREDARAISDKILKDIG
jgi:transcriptional regulator